MELVRSEEGWNRRRASGWREELLWDAVPRFDLDALLNTLRLIDGSSDCFGVADGAGGERLRRDCDAGVWRLVLRRVYVELVDFGREVSEGWAEGWAGSCFWVDFRGLRGGLELGEAGWSEEGEGRLRRL